MSTPGRTLGRYELIARIGEGGMAEVHLARQRGPKAFEKLVVVKTVHPRLAEKPALAEALLEEARIAAKVRHPHVVDIYDLGEEDGTYFIAMEYLEGESLTSIIRAQRAKGGTRLSPLRTAQVVADCAAGLHAAHELRSMSGEPLEVVHQDVTPGNVFVLYTGQAKLLDFGVAKVRNSDDANVVKGKAGYLAPELFDKQPADRRSDVFALGVVLWESLTLRRLFGGPTEADTFAKIRVCDVPAPSTLVADLPPALDAVCARALTRDRDARYPTARAMHEDLLAVLRTERSDYDAMAAYMRETFATHIAARQQLLREIDQGGVPAAGTLEALTATFGERSPVEPAPVVAAPVAAPALAKVPADRKPTGKLAPLPAPKPRLQPLMSLRSPRPSTAPPPLPPTRAPSVPPVVVAAATEEELLEPSGLVEVPSGTIETAPSPHPHVALTTDEVASGELAPPREDDEPAVEVVRKVDDDDDAMLAAAVSGRDRRRWIVGGAIAAVAAIALIAVVASGGGSGGSDAAPTTAQAGDALDAGAAVVAAVASVDAAVAVVAPIDAGAAVALDAGETVAIEPTRGSGSGSGSAAVEPVRDPAKAAALAQTGLKQVMAGDTRGAIASFTAALRADRSHAPAQRGLGLAYEKRGDKARAARAFRDYLRLAPGARDAKQIRARLEQLE
jgi:tRNA A-37 threonylcarbamoyl transferase component Bud32